MSGKTHVDLFHEAVNASAETSNPNDALVVLLASVASSLAAIADHLEGR
jgi:hypothetical protein